MSLQVLFCFHFPHFYFASSFLVVEKSAPPLQDSCSLVLYPEGAQTENSIIRGSNLKGHKPPFWISVNLSDTFKTQMKQKKHSFCVAISRREKDGAQSITSCMVCLITADMSISENTDDFFWFLQNSGSRSCLKGSLMTPTWPYIMF